MEMKNHELDVLKESRLYKAYIDNHRANVKTAYDVNGIAIGKALGLSIADMKQLKKQIEDHDISKYWDEEFEGYRQYFYPVPGETKDKEKFDIAWKHHYTYNRHHYEAWLVNGQPTVMDPVYLAEMILDWEAMSRHFGGNPLDWYEKNKETITLHPITKKDVEQVLHAVYHPGENLKNE